MHIKNTIDSKLLTDFSILENIYLLGRIWADGYIKNGNTHLYAKEGDIEFLFDFFNRMGIFTVYKRQRKNKDGSDFGKPSYTIYLRNKVIYDFLIENEFQEKSTKSPAKILSKIPEDKHYLFWRGYFDGDGCLYIRKNTKAGVLNFWSTIDQDWTSLEECLKSRNIFYNINKYIRKNGKHKSSTLEFRRYESITFFYEYIYNGFEESQIGLKRKYDIFQNYIKLNENFIAKEKNKIRGIRKLPNGKWRACYWSKTIKGKRFSSSIGDFDTQELAIEAREKYIQKNNFIDIPFEAKNKIFNCE